jgi:hypothetical protein
VLSETLNSAVRKENAPQIYDEIPAAIRAELDVDADQDMIVRMRHLALKKRMSRPHITDDEMADYLALAENFRNFEHWISARRQTRRNPVRAGTWWLTVATIIFGLLTAILILSIAITV